MWKHFLESEKDEKRSEERKKFNFFIFYQFRVKTLLCAKHSPTKENNTEKYSIYYCA